MSLLEFKGVSHGGEEGSLLSGVDLALRAGDRLVVFGRSGAGKRTLLRLAAGVAIPASGTVALRDPRPGRRTPVGYSVNDGGLLNNMTLLQNAVLPSVFHRLMGLQEAEGRALKLMEDWGISAQARRRPSEATPAARRLAQLARAFLADPALFVLEDPLEDLDAATTATLRRALEGAFDNRDASVIVATARPGTYLRWGTRFALLSGGALRLFEGRKALVESDDPEASLFLQ